MKFLGGVCLFMKRIYAHFICVGMFAPRNVTNPNNFVNRNWFGFVILQLFKLILHTPSRAFGRNGRLLSAVL